MSKVFTVARAEYLKAVRSKAFIIGVLLTPLLFGGGLIAMAIAEKAVDTEARHFAVLDRTGVLYETIERAAKERNESQIFDRENPEKQVKPRWIPELFEAEGGDESTAELELSERIQGGELLGFLVLGADLFATRRDAEQDAEFGWHTETPTYDDLPDWLEGTVNSTLKASRFETAGLDRELVSDLSHWESLRTLGLTERSKKTGEVIKGEESNKIATIVIPMALMMMLFMLLMMSVPALMNNVLEEKMQRIAEVLLSAVSPFELLLGKLFSAVMMSGTLAIIYLGATLAFVHSMDEVPPQVLEALGPGVFAWFALFLLLALLIYGAMFSALGAACSELQDAQTLMMPAMILLMFPIFFVGPLIQSPDGSLATALSLFPPSTPMIMFLRVTIPPGVPGWQLGVALLTTALFTLACVMAGAKIFRIGILSQGQTPSYRKLFGWLLSK